MNCELCNFKNPKGSTAAVIIQDGKLLVLKRVEEPFKGMWDLPGGYMQEGETPEQTIRREIREELGVDCETDFMGFFPGTAKWKKETFPVLNIAFLVHITGKINIAKKENSEAAFIPIRDMSKIAFDSGRDILAFVKKNFDYDLDRVRILINQLDGSAVFDEQSFYRAILQGVISAEYDGKKLIGFGWAFPRQTLLRRQAVVEDMIVDDAYRGKGLGRKILKDVIKKSKKKGVSVMELTTNPKRIAANELYKSEGFWLHPTNHYLKNL